MKKHTFIRKLYLLLAVIMLFSTVQFPVANALDPIPETVSQETPTEESILTKEELPAYIDYSGAVAAKHVERLESEEELDTLVFRNQDGTYTTYLFDLPIKYVAENGSVQEKDISLVQSSTAYEVASNDIDVMLPFDVSEGIQVSYGTQNVTLSPVQISTVSQQGITAQSVNANILESSVITANTAALNAAENTVTYAQAFDNSINIVYTPLLNGVKEDIVLSSYTGIHTFQFLIETDGMGVYYDEEQELYYINSSETAEGGFNIGRVYIYDQNQRVDIGSMTVTTVEENQTYLLTITANENFLTDEETVYPVTIDPTLTFRQESQIRDAIVYSNYPNGAYGGYQYAYVGKYSNYGTGRLLVGFGDLSDFLSRISSALDIQSANLYLYCGTSSTASTLDVYYNNTFWTESSVKYSTIDWSKVIKSSHSTNIPTAAGWYSIDIKTIVKDWKNRYSSPGYGIVIQNSDEATASKVKCFRTKEYAAAHNGVSMPYLAVTYDGNFPAAHPDDGVYMIKNKNSGKYLDVEYGGTANETNVSQHAYNGADNQKWYLEFLNDGMYSIRPLHAPAMALNVYYGGSANNTNVQIYTFNTNDSASRWTIRYDSEGHYYLNPFCAGNNSLLAVQNNSTANGGNVVIQNADYNADNQKWYLEKCTEEKIVVYDNDNNLYSSGQTFIINIGENKQLHAIYSGQLNSQEFTWSTQNDNIVSVGSTGIIQTKNRGTTTITVKHNTSGISINLNVKVNDSSLSTNLYQSIISEFENKIGSGYFTSSVVNYYTVSQALNIVFANDYYITSFCNNYGIPKEFVQTILFREIWCYNFADVAADELVIEYYEYMESLSTDNPLPKPLIIKEDSSTGLAQAYAYVAINAINHAKSRGFSTTASDFDINNWQDIWYVWRSMFDYDSYSIQCCALIILDAQYEFEETCPYDDFYDFSDNQVKTILSRYNGTGDAAANYGNECFEYFKIFREYNT